MCSVTKLQAARYLWVVGEQILAQDGSKVVLVPLDLQQVALYVQPPPFCSGRWAMAVTTRNVRCTVCTETAALLGVLRKLVTSPLSFGYFIYNHVKHKDCLVF